MTTLVATKEGIWCDTQLNLGDTKVRCKTKTYRVGKTLVATAGAGIASERYVALLRKLKGRIPSAEAASVALWGPKPDPDEPRAFAAVLVTPDGVHIVDSIGCADTISDPWVAVGTGADAAYGALHAGAPPEQAIKIASRVDANTGGDVVFTPLNKR